MAIGPYSGLVPKLDVFVVELNKGPMWQMCFLCSWARDLSPSRDIAADEADGDGTAANLRSGAAELVPWVTAVEHPPLLLIA